VDGYNGEFLSGFFVENAPEYSEWVLVKRERLRSLMIRGLVQFSDHCVDKKEVGLGIQYTGKLLALEPWREESHRQMMLLLAWDGQTQAALA
jgi:DNA-binding SARP family transcriptional activator